MNKASSLSITLLPRGSFKYRDQVIGEHVENVIPNTRMHKVFETGNPEFGVLRNYRAALSRPAAIPILLDAKRIGVVSTFENVTKIQQLEEQIRRRSMPRAFLPDIHSKISLQRILICLS